MTIWRMAFRVGPRGHEMWPLCLSLGVAAITYDPLVYTNLSKYSKYEPRNLWAKLKPTQKASLGRVAYRMKKGDIIYVKHGDKIICRGIVKDKYKFDSKQRIIDPNGTPWSHQVPVKWENNFPQVTILLGGEQVTVLELKQEQLEKLKVSLNKTKEANKLKEALEGEIIKGEALFRSRNRALIQAKKENSDYRCEVCGFNFYETYGNIGKDFIIAHHLKPLSTRRSPSKTTIDDIALLCANCHAMAHKGNSLLTLQELRKHFKK